MKHLVLMRHAKSDWGEANLTDYERPLAPRGVRDAPRIGAELLARGVTPDMLLSSPAVRAKETTKAVCEAAKFKLLPTYETAIYEASCANLLGIIVNLPDSFSTVMLVGHNPGLEELTAQLTGKRQRMPTASIAFIEVECDRWQDVYEYNASLLWLITPKSIAP